MKIIAIGGGEIGRPGKPVETTKIDQEIIALSLKKNPKVLFIPTASRDSRLYVETFQKQFGERLSCQVDTLLLYDKRTTTNQIKGKIASADIIYVGGGNTLNMMRFWKKRGVDVLLKNAAERGTVLSGVSAGAICWFTYGNSDSRKTKNPEADYIRVRGLGLIPLYGCPHYNTEAERQSSMKNILAHGGIAIGLDNCAALEIRNDTYRIISSKPGADGYKCFWKKGAYFVEKLPKDGDFSPLKNLFVK